MDKGTIIRITESVFLPQIHSKHWQANFGEVKRLAMLREYPSNNGNARIIFSDGKIVFINIITDKYEIVKEG